MSKRLSVYLMALPETPELAEAAVEGGADLLELGFPFSDPLADGPVIRLAGERALARACDAAVPRVPRRDRARAGRPGGAADPDDVRVDPRGVRLRALLGGRRRPGATSLIVADLPIEAAPELRASSSSRRRRPSERIELAAERTDGWLYLVSLTGTTGARESVSAQLAGLVERARAVTNVPLLAGFGISTPEQAAAAASLADGVVVGSRAVQVADESGARRPARLRRARCAPPGRGRRRRRLSNPRERAGGGLSSGGLERALRSSRRDSATRAVTRSRDDRCGRRRSSAEPQITSTSPSASIERPTRSWWFVLAESRRARDRPRAGRWPPSPRACRCQGHRAGCPGRCRRRAGRRPRSPDDVRAEWPFR